MLRKVLQLFSIHCLIFFLWSSEASSAEEIETREVKVTATRTEKDLSDIPMSVSVRTAEEQRRNPKTSVAEMLEGIPGITILDDGMPTGKRISIRGETPGRTLILIDGVKVSEQKSMSGAAILIDPSEIERIEVIKGPASVLYGSEAIGGVINIITKKGGDRPIGASTNILYDSSNNGLELGASVFGAYKGFNYRFSASGMDADDYKDGDGTVKDSDFKKRNYAGRIGYDWDKASVYLKVDRYESEVNVPKNTESGIIQFTDLSDVSNPKEAGTYQQTDVKLALPKWDRTSVVGGVELRELTSFLSKIKLDVYAQKLEKDFENHVHVLYDPKAMGFLDTVDIWIDTVNKQNSYGGTAQTEWLIGNNNYLIAGVDYNLDQLRADDSTRRKIGSTSTPRSSSYHYEAEQATVGVFIQDEWTFLKDWTATLGLRQTWVSSALTNSNKRDHANSPDADDNKLVGNVGLVYSGIKDVALRAMWSQGYRFPSLNQLYFGTSHGQSGTTAPNPNLRPESSNNYEIGARLTKGNWNLDTSAFYTYSKNYITRSYEGSAAKYMYDNIDRAHSMGVELALNYTFSSIGLTPYATGMYIYRKYENTVYQVANRGPVYYETSKTGTPPVQGLLGIKWERDIAKSIVLYTDAYMHWATSAKTYEYDAAYAGDFITRKDSGWTTLNFTIGLEGGGLGKVASKWNVALSLRNLLDKTYNQAKNLINDPGFRAVLTAGIEF